jgi:UDP-N-acetylmuramoyl-tripeptide--D-alanyl-D-alanine ligase
VALRGERFDGHDFVTTAVENGAAAVCVDERGASAGATASVPCLVVSDTLRALGDMAHAVRMQQTGPVVGVTGSNGKTTTKELVSAALRARGPVHKTVGNLNNLIGVPLTIFAREAKTWAAVIEMGMNARHEIERLTEIAAPDIGVITTVGPAHLEGLKTIENVARAKAELFEKLPASATAVINIDDALIRDIAAPFAGNRRTISFGIDKADVRVMSVAPDGDGSRIVLDIVGTQVVVALPLAGAHNAANAAAAAACAYAAGVPPHDIGSGLSHVQVPGNRQRILRNVAGGVSIIDDTYNANPQSMIASFATLAQLAGEGTRRIAVIGDMFELGDTAPQLHREVGAAAARSGIGWVLALGPNAESTAAGARDSGARADAFADIGALNEALVVEKRKGDWITVKGSRGMKMERVVAHLTGEPLGVH